MPTVIAPPVPAPPPASAISSLFKPTSSSQDPIPSERLVTSDHEDQLQSSQQSQQSQHFQPRSPFQDDTLYNLALQIKHNLEHQHRWTDLQIHTETWTSNEHQDEAGGGGDGRASGNAIGAGDITSKNEKNPVEQQRPRREEKRTRHVPSRPLVSGLPPTRLYMHPDEQIALLSRSKSGSKNADPDAGADNQDENKKETEISDTSTPALAALMKSVTPEREWVLPSHLNEKWSLRRFGSVFDCVDHVPPAPPCPTAPSAHTTATTTNGDTNGSTDTSTAESRNPWRKQKRVLLATVDTDSTIAYYLVHDGIVKPRQN